MVTGTRSPAVLGWSVRTVVPKVGVVESWKSYWVVPVTGAHENAGVRLVIVEPLAGETMDGTAAGRDWTVNDCIAEFGLVTGNVVLTLQ